MTHYRCLVEYANQARTAVTARYVPQPPDGRFEIGDVIVFTSEMDRWKVSYASSPFDDEASGQRFRAIAEKDEAVSKRINKEGDFTFLCGLGRGLNWVSVGASTGVGDAS